MKRNVVLLFVLGIGMFNISSYKAKGQDSTNCFFYDFEPKMAEIPAHELASEPTQPTVLVTVTGDTLGKISKYYFGNAIAAWMGNVTDNSEFVANTQALSPSLIRYPGGSWSDIFFWNGKPTDLPDSIIDGTTKKKTKFTAISGKNDWATTVDNYYALRQKTGSQGLITINYAYARYGLSAQPVLQAAHIAANWVRYDKGSTRFWEIGNESGAPWEAGWMIDTKTNKDGQPEIITGKLYGQHFKVFADSMRAAAAEVGAKIFIGGQVLHYDGTTSWNSVDKTWNSGFLGEVGDAADFYVMHNYFGTSETIENLTSIATTEPKKNIDFIRTDILAKGASPKPIALTEYNMQWEMTKKQALTSTINGIQEVILFNELIKNNYGLAARWLLASGETGMFYQGSNSSLLWQPRPEFYYAYYQKMFTGDHAILANSSNSSVLAYASKFASGETGVIIVNKSKTAQVVSVNSTEIGFGDKYYLYSLSGGSDNGDFSQYVSVNGVEPNGTEWGPRENIDNIPAKAFAVEKDIFIDCPALSVQFVLIDSGNNIVNPTVSLVEKMNPDLLTRCFPNPVISCSTIEFQVLSPSFVNLTIYDQMGKKITTLLNEMLPTGTQSVNFNRRGIPNGIYFFTLTYENYSVSRKMVLME